MTIIVDDTSASSAVIVDSSSSDISNITDDYGNTVVVYDGVFSSSLGSNINMFALASVPLNDIVPYDIINYGDGIVDDIGSITNITDD